MNEFYKSKEKQLTEIEKQLLKERIFTSIRRIRIKRKLVGVGIAASIALLIGLSLYTQNNTKGTKSELQRMAQRSVMESTQATDKITLILDEGKDVTIDTDESEISYSKTGEQVRINNQNTVVQQNTSAIRTAKFNTLVVPYGKRTALTLSDGSKVWLNAGSKLVYPVAFGSNKREVYLVGEAIFDVIHDANRPFKVLSKHQEIEVLGTVFNVNSYPDDAYNFVVLKEGSVKVSHENREKGFFTSKKKSFIIKPGTMSKIELTTGRVMNKQVAVSRYFAWQKGHMILKNNQLDYILKKLSRYYNIQIELEKPSLGKETFSGALNLSDSLEEVLGIISKSSDTEYVKINDRHYKLKFNSKK